MQSSSANPAPTFVLLVATLNFACTSSTEGGTPNEGTLAGTTPVATGGIGAAGSTAGTSQGVGGTIAATSGQGASGTFVATGGQGAAGTTVGTGGQGVGGAVASTGGQGVGGTLAATGGTTAGIGGTGSTSGSGAAGASGAAGTNGGGAASGTGAGGTSAGTGPGHAVKSPGCGTPPTLIDNTEPVAAGFGVGGRYTLQSGGDNRKFIIRLPDDYDENQPYWLIFGFHWNGGVADEVDSGGTSQYEFSYYGLQKQSSNGAIFVAPQGIGNGWANPGGRDLTFTDGMVELITNDLCVDTTHIISTGFSYGAGMSYALACARADVFDAVVLYEGMVLSGCEGGNDPIAYMQLAGLTDDITRIANARPMRDKFAANNGCTPQDPPEPPPGSLTHICTSYDGCNAGYPLRWCAHGSGHTPAPVDGDPTLVNGIDTWTPPEVWSWLTSL